jgi:hypothetical protein
VTFSESSEEDGVVPPNRPNIVREIVSILKERSDRGEWTDIAALTAELRGRGIRRSPKTVYGILSELANRPELIREWLPEPPRPGDGEEVLRTPPVLDVRPQGRRLFYRLRAYEIRLEDPRPRRELLEIRDWLERYERDCGFYARAAFAPEWGERRDAYLREVAGRRAGHLAEMTWADAAEETADLLRRIRSDEIRGFFGGMVRRFRPDLFGWDTAPRPERAPEDIRRLADRLRGEAPEVPILTDLSERERPAGRPELLTPFRCATDATRLRVESFPLRILLGAARAEMMPGGEPRYAYSTEPPLPEAGGEAVGLPRDLPYVLWGEEEDEYARRAERSSLDRIHYTIEGDVLAGHARWLADRPPPGFPRILIHDGRILPELFRIHDFITLGRAGSRAAEEYVRINRLTLQAFRFVYGNAQDRVLGMVKMERISLPALLLIGVLLNPEPNEGLASEILRDIMTGVTTGDERFSLHLVTGLIGAALREARGGPLMIGPFPRPVAAFQEIPPERLRKLIGDIGSKDPEGAAFLEEIYLPLIERAAVHYLYPIPFRPDGRVCFPRFEIFRMGPSEGGEVRSRAIRLLGEILPEDWEPDRRHEEGSVYRLYIPRIARDVDKGALIAGEELRSQIMSRIDEIRRRARSEGYPF